MQSQETDALEVVPPNSVAFRQSLAQAKSVSELLKAPGDSFWVLDEVKTNEAPYSIGLSLRDGSWIESFKDRRVQPELAITHLRGAVVTAATVLGWNKVDGGVFTKEGKLCPDFKVRTGHQTRQKLDEAHIKKAPMVAGTHLYMGQLNNVYGHFILETLGRCWALDHLTGFDGDFVFQRVRKSDFSHNDVYGELLRGSGIDLSRVRIVDKDTRFENLLVPTAGVDLGKSVHETQVAFYQSILPRLTPQTDTPKKVLRWFNSTGEPKAKANAKRLYLSRKKLPLGTHKFVNEAAIEQTFRRWNFEIVYPEKLSIQEQIALFTEAEIIAGANSSALHNSIFAPKGCSVMMLDGRTGVHGQADWMQVSLCQAYEQPISILECESAMFIDGISRGRLPYLCDLARLERFLKKLCGEPSVDVGKPPADNLTENQLVAQIMISMAFWLSRKNAFDLAKQFGALAQKMDPEAEGLALLTRQVLYRSLRNKSQTPPAIKIFPDEETISVENLQAATLEKLAPIAANYARAL